MAAAEKAMAAMAMAAAERWRRRRRRRRRTGERSPGGPDRSAVGVSGPRGVTGNLPLAGEAKFYNPPSQRVPLNEVLPYAGFPLASEIISMALRCHAPASITV